MTPSGAGIRAFIALLGALVLAVPARAQAARPPLAPEVKKLIDENGPEGAQEGLMMLLVRALTEFDVDDARMVGLARGYTEAGDPDAAFAVLRYHMLVGGENNSAMSTALGDAHLGKGESEQALMRYGEALRLDPENARALEQVTALGGSPSTFTDQGEGPQDLGHGEERSDLDRFKGRYSLPDQALRVVSVSETCLGSGYLTAVPEWADVAPWDLRSESDLVFLQFFFWTEPARLEFEADASGTIVAVLFSGNMEGRFERIGDLAAGWESAGDDCRS